MSTRAQQEAVLCAVRFAAYTKRHWQRDHHCVTWPLTLSQPSHNKHITSHVYRCRLNDVSDIVVTDLSDNVSGKERHISPGKDRAPKIVPITLRHWLRIRQMVCILWTLNKPFAICEGGEDLIDTQADGVPQVPCSS
ncbi:hypothetical protein J6590_013458 [Homalodisca vitripennis]|nr:hypothetical protein J6590_013458 [Homalodisca vitripennis]